MNWQSLVGSYLALKRHLGYELIREREYLQNFARFAAKQSDADSLSIDLALRWANLTHSDADITVAKRFGVIRPFSRYLAMLGHDAVILPTHFLPSTHRRLPPYIFSETEVSELMSAALNLPPKSGLRPITIKTFIGLLVSTGMRPGEAVRLQCKDGELNSGEIAIHNSKGWKQRLIPLSPSTVDALRVYMAFRENINLPGQVTSFFQLDNGRTLNMRSAAHAFGCLREATGLSIKFNGRYPRLYDLRHTFVCRRVLDWYQSGDEVDCRVAQLSRYIGHKKVSNTYWYLTATPALMACAAERFSAGYSGEPL